MIFRSCLLITLLTASAARAEFEVFGWGHGVRGGEGGTELMVTRLDDDVKKPVPGMLRWALKQKGARVIRFAVQGEVWLKDRILVREGRVTVDGSNAPGQGVCLRGGSLEFVGCQDIILRHFRVRLGDETVLRKLKQARLKRPKGSTGLDCVNLADCRGVVLDHLSLAWSCDELLSVVRSQRVTVQWCLLAEPLGQPKLHPYGDKHAFGINASASTLSIHHCVMAHYWMRGPQFEANDMRRGDAWQVKMEAVSNVMADFGRSGSRYTTGVEDHQREVTKRRFEFQFAGNVYLDTGDTGRSIEAVTRHGTHAGVKVWMAGNWFRKARGDFAQEASAVRLENGSEMVKAPANVRRQVSAKRLFTSPNSPAMDLGGPGLGQLLGEVGAGPVRDADDKRTIQEILQEKVRPVVASQRDLP
jgi:hypothetical protein